MASRKRLYRHRVRCEECNKEIDSDYKEVHSRLVHNGKKVKCHPVMESSDSSQSLMHTVHERISYIKYVIATSGYTLVTFWLSLEIVMNIHIQLITEMPRDNIFLFISRNCQSSKESLSLVVLSYQQ